MAFRGDYTVKLFNPDGTDLDYLSMDRIINLTYDRRMNDIGTISITLDADDKLSEQFGVTDVIADVYRRNDVGGDFELEDSYFIRYWNRFEDDSGDEYLIYSGPHVTHLVTRRIILPDDDPNEAGGFSSKFGPADTVMGEFITEQCVNPTFNTSRSLTGLKLSVPVGNGNNVFQRRAYEPLIDVISEISVKSQGYNGLYTQIDFRVAHAGLAKFFFYAEPRGSDRTYRTNHPDAPSVTFTPIRANMTAPSLTIDRNDEATFAWVGGQGIANQRIVFPIASNEEGASPWNLIEVYTDARSNDDTDGLYAAGLDALNDRKQFVDFSFTPDLDGFQGRYNADWTLGDYVTAQYAGYEQDVRIQSVSISVAEDEAINIQLENILI